MAGTKPMPRATGRNLQYPAHSCLFITDRPRTMSTTAGPRPETTSASDDNSSNNPDCSFSSGPIATLTIAATAIATIALCSAVRLIPLGLTTRVNRPCRAIATAMGASSNRNGGWSPVARITAALSNNAVPPATAAEANSNFKKCPNYYSCQVRLSIIRATSGSHGGLFRLITRRLWEATLYDARFDDCFLITGHQMCVDQVPRPYATDRHPLRTRMQQHLS